MFYILPKKPISSDYAANFHDNETCSVFQQGFESFDAYESFEGWREQSFE